MKELQDAIINVMINEKKVLTAKQQQIDVHEPEKDELTAKDFEMLRAGKKAKAVKEEQVAEVAPMVAAAGRAIATMAAKKVATSAINTAVNKMTSSSEEQKEEKELEESSHKKYGSEEAGKRVAGAVLKKVTAKEEYTEEELQLIETAIEEGWDDMMKAAQERGKPQPSGGAGVKLGTRYGGGKQKPEKVEKPVKEDVEYSFGDYLKVAKEKYGEEEAVKIANDAFNKKDVTLFSNDSEA